MELTITSRTLRFVRVDLSVSERGVTDVFARMNSQTVAGMIAKRRYAHLMHETAKRYPDDLMVPIGEFLYRLKYRSDPIYRRFLNNY